MDTMALGTHHVGELPKFREEVSTAFRGAMRRLAAAVSIVTIRSKRSWHGITVTAVTSVSLEPPTLLICINRATRIHPALACAEARFCVNVLHSGQEDIATAFGGRVGADDRFRIGDWRCDDGAPYLADAQANVSCQVTAAFPHGSHTIFIGAVQQVRVAGVVSPLMYADGRYIPFVPSHPESTCQDSAIT